jgi:general stress protein 26
MATQTDRDAAVRKLGEMIKEIEVAMLTTVDDDGTLRSRPMVTQKTDFDGDLWFFTRADSPKVDEVRRAEAVNLSYATPAKDRRFNNFPKS